MALSASERTALEARLAAVGARVREACARAGRPAHSVRLIAVSKGHGADAIRAAYDAGQRDFGESYVQELKQKAAALADLSELRFRFIGRLQRNKAKDVAALGVAVDSVDSIALAQELSSRAARLGRELEVLLQVNLDREAQKAGVPPESVAALVEAVRALPALRLRGLMAIPRPSDEPVGVRPAFAALRTLGAHFGLPELSMGMSEDLEVAVEEGATMLRVGTAIFGLRP